LRVSVRLKEYLTRDRIALNAFYRELLRDDAAREPTLRAPVAVKSEETIRRSQRLAGSL